MKKLMKKKIFKYIKIKLIIINKIAALKNKFIKLF